MNIGLILAVITVLSPDGRNEISIETEGGLRYSVVRDGKTLLAPSPMGMRFAGRGAIGGSGSEVVKVARSSRKGRIETPLYKKAFVDDNGNEARVSFKGGWHVDLHARNDGVAYRFVTDFPDQKVKVQSETSAVEFPSDDVRLYVNYDDPKRLSGGLEKFQHPFEVTPVVTNASGVLVEGEKTGLIFLPLVAKYPDGTALCVTESDVLDYPDMSLSRLRKEDKFLSGRFPAFPDRTKDVNSYWYRQVGARLDYLAETAGRRTYPWRVFVVADRMAALCEQDISFALATPSKIGDAKWVKPGRTAWDWWNDWNISGVPFRAGCNTETYLHYIDFAAENGLEYFLLDEGWGVKMDAMTINPAVDLAKVIRHADEKGVGIILWVSWMTIEGRIREVFSRYRDMGVKGFKVDFFQRDDQDMNRFIEQVASVAAELQLVLDLHSTAKTRGFSRTYPNVLNYEGVLGLENVKWREDIDYPSNDLLQYFVRMTAGPMDYTPGAMRNVTPKCQRGVNAYPASQGTRVHQMALMSLYEAPLQMFCDSPTMYRANKDCLDFMAKIPSVWDETVGVAGSYEEGYAACARRKGSVWHLAAICGKEPKTVDLPLSFLGEGKWQAEIFEDGPNADRFGEDRVRSERVLEAGAALRIKMSCGGGFAARLCRAEPKVPTATCSTAKFVREFVMPRRVVWSSGVNVSNAKLLLTPKNGQVPEVGWGWVKPEDAGCGLQTTSNAVASILLDFGRELHGGLQIAASAKSPGGQRVRVRFGESVGEAMSELGDRGSCNDHAIRDSEIVLPMMGTREIGNTGFRFVRIDLVSPGNLILEGVRAISVMRSMNRLGDFTCSDERLNGVFETSVRTVHLCCQDYLWDGIKRDRLVWMGDTYPETMAILNVFGADSILPESLDYISATTPEGTWVNDMCCYSLWWVRNLAAWHRYADDPAYLQRIGDRVERIARQIADHVTPSNTWEVTETWDSAGFLDWPTEHNRKATADGKQALARQALEDAAYLADELGKADLGKTCRAAAGRLATLRLEPHGAKSAAAVLALSGSRSPEEMFDQVLGKDGYRGVSTFYGYFMLEAMSAAGHDALALNTVRDYWGAMLDVGATSFWENFDIAWTNGCTRIDEMPTAGLKDIHGDYGEFCYPGYRHSLCHGWSAGPAAWLINHVLGIRPLEKGCRKVEVRPFLGDLVWAEGAMALPDGGAVKVRVEKRADGTLDTKVDAPSWVKIVK